ncbi:MAG: PaaI family thioesterase [Solirubrobacteraceae bacterium]
MPRPDPSDINDLIPFAAVVRIELLTVGADLVRGRIRWAPERCTAGGVMHGGVITALADHCGGVCAFLNLPEGAQGTTTVESKTNFLRSIKDGAITATTRPLHQGRTLMVLERPQSSARTERRADRLRVRFRWSTSATITGGREVVVGSVEPSVTASWWSSPAFTKATMIDVSTMITVRRSLTGRGAPRLARSGRLAR